MTITASTVPKFCANIRAALPESFFLDLKSLVISRTMEPWPECQPKESRPIGSTRSDPPPDPPTPPPIRSVSDPRKKKTGSYTLG